MSKLFSSEAYLFIFYFLIGGVTAEGKVIFNNLGIKHVFTSGFYEYNEQCEPKGIVRPGG